MKPAAVGARQGQTRHKVFTRLRLTKASIGAARLWQYRRPIGVTMFRTRARLIKMLVFVALLIGIDWAIEWTELRPKALTATVDSISLATGLGSPLIENLVVALIAWLFFQIILLLTDSLRFLTGERKREFRLPDSLPREDGPVGE
jgi:hypothetical protein